MFLSFFLNTYIIIMIIRKFIIKIHHGIMLYHHAPGPMPLRGASVAAPASCLCRECSAQSSGCRSCLPLLPGVQDAKYLELSTSGSVRCKSPCSCRSFLSLVINSRHHRIKVIPCLLWLWCSCSCIVFAMYTNQSRTNSFCPYFQNNKKISIY